MKEFPPRTPVYSQSLTGPTTRSLVLVVEVFRIVFYTILRSKGLVRRLFIASCKFRTIVFQWTVTVHLSDMIVLQSIAKSLHVGNINLA